MPPRIRPWPLVGTVLLAGCSGMYYSALERVGIEKRELLLDRVASARDAQQEAQRQFKDALEQFQALVGYDGGELESVYDRLSEEYDASQTKAQAVRDRIAAVKDVATVLFREWEAELAEYTDADLRRQSQKQLAETRTRYARLVTAMDRAAARMNPVLAVLHDQVLFLKHNLNARALGSLDATADALQADVSTLIKEMEKAISEANTFITAIGGPKTTR